MQLFACEPELVQRRVLTDKAGGTWPEVRALSGLRSLGLGGSSPGPWPGSHRGKAHQGWDWWDRGAGPLGEGRMRWYRAGLPAAGTVAKRQSLMAARKALQKGKTARSTSSAPAAWPGAPRPQKRGSRETFCASHGTSPKHGVLSTPGGAGCGDAQPQEMNEQGLPSPCPISAPFLCSFPASRSGFPARPFLTPALSSQGSPGISGVMLVRRELCRG